MVSVPTYMETSAWLGFNKLVDVENAHRSKALNVGQPAFHLDRGNGPAFERWNHFAGRRITPVDHAKSSLRVNQQLLVEGRHCQWNQSGLKGPKGARWTPTREVQDQQPKRIVIIMNGRVGHFL